MNRRTFIALSATTPFLLHAEAKAKEISPNVWHIIQEVQNILFPKTTTMPSASEFHALEYLVKNISHATFNSDDFDFLPKGALFFERYFPKFLKASLKKKQEMMEKASEDDYFEQWFARLIYYGFEAMLSDPLYGGNPKMVGWIALQHAYGVPQPTKKYGQHV